MKVKEIKEAIKKLVDKGNHTLLLIGNGSEDAIYQFIREYNAWYSEALPLVRNLLSDRLTEFESLYHSKTSPKEIHESSYSIEDYLVKASYLVSSFDILYFKTASNVTKSKFNGQISIVESVGVRLDSILVDIRRVLQADLFDSELDVARELKRNGYLRMISQLLICFINNQKLSCLQKLKSHADVKA